MAAHGYHRTLFLFYAEADRNIATNVFLPELRLPPSEIATREDLRLGSVITQEFASLVEHSQYTLLLVSPALFDEDWATHVQNLAKHADIEGAATLITADLEKVSKPLDLRVKVSLDFTDQRNWTHEFRRLRDFLALAEPAPVPPPLCPYPGMLPYGSNASADRFFFHGRKRETKWILNRLRDARRLFVIGPSGSGKSSLVQAGVIPALKSSSLFARELWHVIDTRPGTDPVAALQSALQEAAVHLTAPLTDRKTRRVLLVIDQFEELFALASRDIQKQYIATLNNCGSQSGCTTIIIVRADFLSELMESDLWPIADSDRIEVAPLRGDALREAIDAPAQAQGVVLDRALVQRLMLDAADEPGPLPLLQEAMVRLWDSVRHHYLPLSAYEELTGDTSSGLARVLSDSADKVFQHLSPPEQAIARRIFLGLVQEGSGRPDTRRQRIANDLRSAGDEPETFNRTVSVLVSQRLLTADVDRQNTLRKLDLAHEALIRSWQTLREWLSKYREARMIQERLAEKAREWLGLNRQGGLLDRYQLAEAERWLEDPLSKDIGQSEAVLDYVAASRSAIEKADRLEQERLKMLAEEAERRAEAERLRALEQRRLRLQSVSLYLASHVQRGVEERERAALLARQAFLLDQESGGGASDQVYGALVAALDQPDIRIALRAHDCPIERLSLSDEGCLLASADSRGSVRLWDVAHLEAARYLEMGGNPRSEEVQNFDCIIQSLCFSFDAQTLAVLDEHGDLWLFEVDRGSIHARLREKRSGFTGAIDEPATRDIRAHRTSSGFLEVDDPSILFRPDGTLARHCLIYDSSKGEFMPDGNEYVRASARRLIEQHGLDVPHYTVFRGGSRLPCTVVSSSDGTLLLVGYVYPGSSTVTLWKLDAPQPWTQELRRGGARNVSFSRDGKRLFFIGEEGCEVWDTNWPPTLLPDVSLKASDGTALAADGAGKTVAIGYDNGEIWIWRAGQDSATRVCCEVSKSLESCCLEPTRAALAAWAQDGCLAVYRTRGTHVSIALPPAPGTCFESRQSTTEKLAYAIWENHHWQSDENWREAVRVLRIRKTAQQVFSRLGWILKIVQLTSGEYALAIWDADKGDQPVLLNLSGALGETVPLALGQAEDGAILIASATAKFGSDASQFAYRVYRIPNLESPEVTLQVSDSIRRSIHQQILWAAFSPNGRFLVSQGYWPSIFDDVAGAIAVWDLRRQGTQPITLIQRPGICTAVAFAFDEERLALGFPDAVESGVFQPWRQRRKARNAASRILMYDLTQLDKDAVSLPAFNTDISALAFAPAGNTLAAGSTTGRIMLFNLEMERASPIPAGDHKSEILSLFYAANGLLLSAAADGTIRSSLTDNAALAGAICDRVSHNLSAAAWNHFIGLDIPYQCTCPHYGPNTASAGDDAPPHTPAVSC
jgi:WD40 repeat protein